MRRPRPTPTSDTDLYAVLERARTVGFLGPGPLHVHVEHAAEFGAALPPSASNLLDLGSGGGVPGLPILRTNPQLTAVLLDASQKRGSFLVWALAALQLEQRVSVVVGRAEVLGHDLDLRSQFDVVVSRGFGPPATTVECGAPFLASGGRLLVSEPPEGRDWPSGPLRELGLAQIPPGPGRGISAFELTARVPARYPRSSKQQRSHPLF